MIKLDGIATFITVAEAGSLSAAARRLGVSNSVVSDRLAELERTLGGRLIQRTTRRLTMTEDGLSFLVRARRIVAETEQAASEMAERHGRLTGPLRISAPVSFGILHLNAALWPFLAAHPGIELALELDDRFVDAAAAGFDAVIRHAAIGDNRLVVRRLATSRRMLVAAPAYLAARGSPPATLASLHDESAILYSNRSADWRFPTPDGAVVVHPKRAHRFNNGLMMRDAAVAGLGIALLPSFMVNRELASGALAVVDIGLAADGADIFIAYPSERPASAKLRALTRHLRASFGSPPYWDVQASKV